MSVVVDSLIPGSSRWAGHDEPSTVDDACAPEAAAGGGRNSQEDNRASSHRGKRPSPDVSPFKSGYLEKPDTAAADAELLLSGRL